MRGIVCQIHGLVRILAHVVELFRRALSIGQRLRRRQLAVRVHRPDLLGDGESGPIVPLHQRAVGHEVADVVIAIATNRTDAIDGEAAPIPRGEDVFAPVVVGEQVLRIHVRGNIEAGQRQRCRGDVHQRGQVRASRPGFHGLRHPGRSNDERHAQAFFVAELFGPRHVGTVVAEEKDDRVFPQPIGLQAIQEPSYLVIGQLHGVQMIGNLVADLWYVRILRGYRNGRWIDWCRAEGG